jgi:hypothetical protein
MVNGVPDAMNMVRGSTWLFSKRESETEQGGRA